MNEMLLDHIGEVYDGSAWEALTGILWEKDQPWQLRQFEQDVAFDGQLWRCVIIRRSVFDPEDLTAVDYVEDVFCRTWAID